MATEAVRRRDAGSVRADRARRRLGRRQHAHHGSSLDDGQWVIKRLQAVHHQQRHRHLGLRHTSRPGPRATTKSATSWSRTPLPATRSARPIARWAGTRRHPPAELRGRPRAAGDPRRARGQGFKQFLQTLDGGRIGVAAMGLGLAQGRARRGAGLRARGSPSGADLLTRHSRSSCRPVHGDRGRPPADLPSRSRKGTWGATSASPPPRPSSRRAAGGEGKRGSRPDPRRLRLHRGVPGVPLYRDAKV